MKKWIFAPAKFDSISTDDSSRLAEFVPLKDLVSLLQDRIDAKNV